MTLCIARWVLSAAAVASIALTPAAAQAPAAPFAAPSKLDYLVFASLAESQHPLAMSAYRGVQAATAAD